MRLKSKLLSLNADKADKDKVKIFSPKNCEELRIPFRAERIAKVVGKLAEIPPPTIKSADDPPPPPRLITGVLVQNDFKMSLMAPEDLREYAGLTTTIITCKQRLRLSAAGIELIKWALESTFGAIEEVVDDRSAGAGGKAITINGNSSSTDEKKTGDATSLTSYLVMGCVMLRHDKTTGEIELEWEGNMLNDGIADAVMAVLFTVESSPAAVKRKLP